MLEDHTIPKTCKTCDGVGHIDNCIDLRRTTQEIEELPAGQVYCYACKGYGVR